MTPAEASKTATSFYPIVQRWAASYVDEQDAADVAHQVLEVFLRRAAEVHENGVAQWLRTTTWRVASNHRRKSRREIPSAQAHAEADDVTPEVTLVSAQLAAETQAALERVASSRRPIVVDVELRGATFADVARDTGTPESTVRLRHATGIAELRDDLRRQRVAEARRTGGHTSWLVFFGLKDVRAIGKKVIAALGATAVLGGALLHIDTVELSPTAIEAPQRETITEPLRFARSDARAERGADVVAPKPRQHHDVHARMRRARWR